MPGSLELESRAVSRVALLGRDYRRVNFELLCSEGDEVRAGDALMRDARRPQIRFNAPLAGRVAGIERGARRKLISVQINVDDSLGVIALDRPKGSERDSLREFMLECGAWSSLRNRPFGNIPDPDAQPAAIFVSTLDAQPLAPDPKPVIEAYRDEFAAAIDALANLVDAPLYLCHAPGEAPLETDHKIHCVAFNGGHSAGLPGVHINALCPIGFGRGEVWQLGYQDAIAFGHQLLHASPWLQRVVSLGGDGIKNPRNLLTAPGASLTDLLEGELVEAGTRLLAGSEIYGRSVAADSFLEASQRQVTAMLVNSDQDVSSSRFRSGTIIPGDQIEELAPPGIFPVPLMRALQLGDVERARDLGALELLEEDVAPLGQVCLSNNDYPVLLRAVLDRLEAAR